MNQSIKVTGIVLHVMPIGEYDKRVIILTSERGKITAFARGARRQKSPMQAAMNLFCFGEFEVFEGRDAYSAVKVEIKNYFRELSTDLDMTYYGCYFLELADYFCHADDDSKEQLKLLYQTLKALSVKSLDHRLVRYIYELKLLYFHGVYPSVYSCIACGSKTGLHKYSYDRHGMCCDSCKVAGREIILSESALYALQYIGASPLDKLYTFTVSASVLDELGTIAKAHLKLYKDKPLKTERFLV